MTPPDRGTQPLKPNPRRSRSITRFVSTLLKYGTFISTLGFVAIILLQIFARLFLASAPSWTEEAARVCFVYAVGFAAGLALRSGEYVNFDFFYQRLPPPWQRRLTFVIDGLTVVLFALFSYHAAKFTLMGLAERSPTLRFPMAIPFAAMFILGLSVLVFAVGRINATTRPKYNHPNSPINPPKPQG